MWINKIYYFFILRPGRQVEGADFYFTGAVINLDNLHKIEVNKKKTTSKSVFLNYFIDNDYGNIKIYKAKKRLELRLNPKKWIENGFSLKISTSFSNNPGEFLSNIKSGKVQTPPKRTTIATRKPVKRK